jgi:surface protein
MFQGATAFNQDISNWNVSKVIDMASMFRSSPFNQNISNWNVSNVRNMASMFRSNPFNQNISNWIVSSVTNMASMFQSATAFNQNISNWNVSTVTDMTSMFESATAFNQNISNWDVSLVTSSNNFNTNGHSAFQGNNLPSFGVVTIGIKKRANGITLYYNGTTSTQDPLYVQATVRNGVQEWFVVIHQLFFSHVKTYSSATVTSPDENGVRKLTSSSNSYHLLTFIQPGITTGSDTDISNYIPFNNIVTNFLTDLSLAFVNLQANRFLLSTGQSMESWDTINVTKMNLMYAYTPATGTGSAVGEFANGPNVSNWNVSNVTTLQDFALSSNFNQPLNTWNVSNVTRMSGMFRNSPFNQPLSNWDVSNVNSMNSMFQSATAFNQNISNWNVSKVTNMTSMFQSATAFNQNISNWNVSLVNSRTNFNTSGHLEFQGDKLPIWP